MSMVITLHRVSDSNLQRVLAHPPYFNRILFPDDPACWGNESLSAPQKGGGLFARLFGRPQPALTAATPLPPAPEFASGELQTLELDKVWHGVHYLFTGSEQPTPEPAGFLMAGTELEARDLDYGRIISAADIRAVDTQLRSLSDAELQARYQPEHMNMLDVYGKPWHPDPDMEEDLAFLMSAIAELRPFVAEAAARNEGLFVTLG